MMKLSHGRIELELREQPPLDFHEEWEEVKLPSSVRKAGIIRFMKGSHAGEIDPRSDF